MSKSTKKIWWDVQNSIFKIWKFFMEMLEISDDGVRPEVAEIGQKFFYTQKNIPSMSDDNMDLWKRFLTEKSWVEAFC